MSGPGPERLGLTTLLQVAVAALAGALLGVVLRTGFVLSGTFPPLVPWSVPAVLAVMALGAWGYSRGLARRVAEHSAPGIEAVRALVVAKSMVMTGAVLAGLHVVYVLDALPRLEASAPAARVGLGAATLVASTLLAWAGHALEKACLVPKDPSRGADGGPRYSDTPAD